ncbi:MAG: CoB--CoM heterodisulfide reductase iron-sulfur subunit B family protein [Candidatus Thermoplasmatota archaeon]|jgi:heterodisulfide reductase subunit B|nr:CoB--CoM heterodisulfide reductase iron-sulfur subunit B family protein [Candidatus Thermoplasmatota archaeon]
MKKKYALFTGCMMSTEQYAYELSVRESLQILDVELVDLEGFSCCGEPIKSVNQLMTLYLSARNISIAEKNALCIFAPCAMCHLALSECKHILENNEKLKERINKMLAEEDLNYNGSIDIIHTVDLLHDIIGLEEIKKHVKKPLTGLKFATHYGCHLIRPSEIGRPVNSENPLKMEEILKVLGAEPVNYYPEKLDCCGGILQINLPESALTKTGQKLKAIQECGFSGLVDVCPWCHRMYDARQVKAGETVATKLELPVFYLTQLLGLAFGIEKEKLGLDLNQSPVDKIVLKMAQG